MKFIGYQKGFDGEILASCWNITAGHAAGTTVYLSPEPTEAEKAAKLAEKSIQFESHK
jgi:hypothetical protein